MSLSLVNGTRQKVKKRPMNLGREVTSRLEQRPDRHVAKETGKGFRKRVMDLDIHTISLTYHHFHCQFL